MGQPKILVTGFKPFLGESINPSAILIEKLAADPDFGGSIQTLLLPVVFNESAKLLISQLKLEQPKVVLMLGQASGRPNICLERVALNWVETTSPDESGWIPPLGPIDPSSEKIFFTELPVEKWVSQLAEEDLKVPVSLSAGGYVCNHLYFTVLRYLASLKMKQSACFIHVPYLPEQTIGKEPMPASLDLEVQYKTIKKIVDLVQASL